MENNKKIGTLDLNKIHQGDCLKLLKSLPDSSVDLVITSPPYNLAGLKLTYGKKVGKGKGDAEWYDHIDYDGYKDDMPEPLYMKWQLELLDEIWRVLKESGSCFYNHKDRMLNGRIHSPMQWVTQSKLNLRQTIVWEGKASMNNNNTIYTPSTEYVYWLTKSTTNVRFEKQPYLEKKGERKGEYIPLTSVWTIPHTAGQFEFTWKGKTESHPAPYPLEIIDRIIPSILGSQKMRDELGDNITVLDPFCGSATTAVGAIKYGCNWLGFEQSEKYVAMGYARIKKFIETGKEY